MKVAQLRQSILQAAVQGKLVPQDEHDESGDKLLERIRQEKMRLIKEGKLKKEKPLPLITKDEVPFDLPDGWTWYRLGELVSKIGSGSTPTGGRNVYVKNGIKFLRSQNVYNSGLTLHGVAYIDATTHEKMSGTVVHPRDILLNITGASIGRCCIVDDDFDTGNVNQHVSIIRTIDQETRYFLHVFLISPYLQKHIMDTQVGVSREGLSGEKIKLFVVPLPPLAEQQRIVAKVNELMALCDELEAAEKALDKLEADFAEYLPKTILLAAVQGKLVPQNSHDEPASELLRRIQQEKARLVKDGKLRKEKTLPPVAEDDVPFDLPEGWVWCRLGDIHSIARGITFPATVKHKTPAEGDVCCATTGSVQKEYNPKADIYVPEQYVKNESQWLRANDIIMSTANSRELVGKTCVWKTNARKTFGGFLTVVRSDKAVSSMYSYYVLQFLWADGAFNTSSTQTTNIANINNEILMNTLFPLPPLAEQQRIVAKVDELMALCDELKAEKGSVLTPAASNVVPFPAREEEAEDEEQVQMVARGKVSRTASKELQQAQVDLFGDIMDE